MSSRKGTKKTEKKTIERKIIKDTRKRVTEWFLRYDGPHKHIKLPGIGRIISGKEYSMDESRARQFEATDPKKGWKVIRRISYVSK